MPTRKECPYADYCHGQYVGCGHTTRPPKFYLVSPDKKAYVRVRYSCRVSSYTLGSDEWRKRVSRFLGAGWFFSATPIGKYMGSIETKGVPEYAPKGTPEVRPATTRTSNDVHGGDNASGEVPDAQQSSGSPAGGDQDKKEKTSGEVPDEKNGERKKRVHRGKKKKKTPHRSQIQWGGGNEIFSPPGFRKPSESEKKAAQEAANIFLKWLGTGEPKEEEEFDLLGFVKAVQIGEDLRPYIQSDIEREETVRILITPDQSGSTCSWSDVSTAFAYALQEQGKKLGVSVALIPNFNGTPVISDQDVSWSEIERVDVVLYLGDNDAMESIQKVPANRIIALSNVYSSVRDGEPRICQDIPGVIWVEGVAGRDVTSFTKALKILGNI